mmetsp:Transcript_8922/g.29401  ORF Transcript_8922/g.29401 Transcript_8922/m.29401 type:complete len:213 (-) Transcript_8922:2154-2792(-)
MVPAFKLPAFWTWVSNKATRPTLGPLALPRTTAAPSPSRAAKFSAATFKAAGSTLSKRATSTLESPTSRAWETNAPALATANSPRRLSASFCVARKSSCKLDTRLAISSGGTRNVLANCFTTASRCCKSSTTPAPATASMRRIPLAMPASLKILNPPISAVLETCVPPHNSMEMPGTSTTRTTSPYFSPNIAVAPRSLALAIGISSAIKSAL